MDFCLGVAVLCGTSIEAFNSLQVYYYVPLIQQRKDGADLKSPMAPFLPQAVLAEMAWESAAGERQYKCQDGSIDDDPSLRTPDTLARELQASRTGRSQRQDLASERQSNIPEACFAARLERCRSHSRVRSAFQQSGDRRRAQHAETERKKGLSRELHAGL